jgi:hypothetical protein
MNPQRAGAETLEETRLRLQRRIYALRGKRDTYAAYGDPASADSLLIAIGLLEQQLQQTHKPERKPTTQRKADNDQHQCQH